MPGLLTAGIWRVGWRRLMGRGGWMKRCGDGQSRNSEEGDVNTLNLSCLHGFRTELSKRPLDQMCGF